MKSFSADPNQEVETWKDDYFRNFNNVSTRDLAAYLEKDADQIVEKYNLKHVSVKKIKTLEFAA